MAYSLSPHSLQEMDTVPGTGGLSLGVLSDPSSTCPALTSFSQGWSDLIPMSCKAMCAPLKSDLLLDHLSKVFDRW